MASFFSWPTSQGKQKNPHHSSLAATIHNPYDRLVDIWGRRPRLQPGPASIQASLFAELPWFSSELPAREFKHWAELGSYRSNAVQCSGSIFCTQVTGLSVARCGSVPGSHGSTREMHSNRQSNSWFQWPPMDCLTELLEQAGTFLSLSLRHRGSVVTLWPAGE